jgi:hypothetical protein
MSSNLSLKLRNLEKTQYENIYLNNFFKDTSDPFLDIHNFKGDVTKNFLVDLVAKAIPNATKPIVISFENNRDRTIPERFKRKLLSLKNRQMDNLGELNEKYGYRHSVEPIPGVINLWFSGENIRPPLSDGWDAFFSYDSESFDGKNIYLPLWVTRLAPTLIEASARQDSMAKGRDFTFPKTKQVCIVASNPEPIRMFFAEKLAQVLDVDYFGSVGAEMQNKFTGSKPYKFSICFENDLYPGYITEKPFEAWLSGCIPIWRGLDSHGFLNKSAMIDVSNKPLDAAVDEILELSSNNDLLINYMNQPILATKFNLSNLTTRLGNILG